MVSAKLNDLDKMDLFVYIFVKENKKIKHNSSDMFAENLIVLVRKTLGMFYNFKGIWSFTL